MELRSVTSDVGAQTVVSPVVASTLTEVTCTVPFSFSVTGNLLPMFSESSIVSGRGLSFVSGRMGTRMEDKTQSAPIIVKGR